MAIHSFEEEDPYGANSGPNSSVKTNPVKRIRWATQRAKPGQGIKKRQSILDRFHKRHPSDKSAQSGATSPSNDSDDNDTPQPERRTIYFNMELPDSARDEEGHPLQQYPRNKIRTAKYTPLSFIPKNLWFQFHNIANIYFLFIIILSIFPIFGATNAGLSSVPLIVILFVTAVKDAIEDARRTVLDNELNNTPVHRLVDWSNVNTAEDRVGIWRKFKKATSRGIGAVWNSWKKTQHKKKGKTYAENALDMPARGSADTRRDSTWIDRPSNDGVEMHTVGADRPSYEQKRSSWAREDLTIGKDNSLQVPGNEKAHQFVQRDYGNFINPAKETSEKARFKKEHWKNVQVGDFVRLYNEEQIPADIVVLATSDPDGACYVETKNLDGETNLKVRQALHAGRKVKRARDCEQTEFWIESEPPHANLYNYSGVARWNQRTSKDPSAPPVEMAEPISINNMLLRGCSVRNTEWVLGIAVFTGTETKIMLNSGITPSKRAKISKDLNWNVIYNFIILFLMCLVSGIVEGTFWGRSDTTIQFFEFGSYGGTAALNGIITFWAALVLFQNLVPISLYITLEIIRTIQAFFIYSDTFMYYEPVDYPCTPKSWNISDDLGQIEYIFSDKTGTLTQNVMEFKKATINGIPYGEAYTEAQAGMQKRQGVDTEAEGARAHAQIAKDRVRMIQYLREQHDNPYLVDDELTFVAPDFVQDLRGESGQEQKTATEDFMLALALCHTVITERTPGDPPRIEFKAQSPDEAALVATARDCGFTVIGRTREGILINMQGKEQEFTVMNTLEFNSTRKRMSAIIRMPNGKIMLFCKGADSIIYSRLTKGEQTELRKQTAEHLEMFAREGLRTLCIARKEISEEYYQKWSKEHDIAAAAVENRDDKLEEVSNEIEQDLTLIGGTAIEDRLQDGVPDTISLLANAGIKLWVLTGDKVETAINIGFSCNLLNNDMDLLIVKVEDDNIATAEAELDKYLRIFGITGSDEELKLAKTNHEPPAPTHAIVIDGDSLKLVLEDALRQKFLLLCKQCKAVLCCRVSPAQKAAVVRMVKRGLDVITLSIGDGANDVAMIQEADIGIGIAGEEGRQAVMSSDFAIGQFRFLARLTLVHGRWNYRRMAETIANFFYKNIVWTFALFWYQIYANFDCQYIFDYTYILLYNLAFTSLAVIFLGILDQDVSDKVSLAVPQLYRRGIERLEWSQLKFWLYMGDGFYQSLICFFMPYLLFAPATFNTSNGLQLNDYKRMGVFIATAAVVVVNVYILLNTYRWDWATFGITMISILLIWLWTGAYSAADPRTAFQFYGAAQEVYGSLSFWTLSLLVVVLCLLPRFCIKAYQKMYLPRDVDIIREQVQQGKFDYLDDVDPTGMQIHNVSAKHMKGEADSSGSSDGKGDLKDYDRYGEDRPMYPPSMAPTATTGTRNPHSQQGSDDSTYPGRPAIVRTSTNISEGPRISFDRPRPSFDRMRSSMDRIRPSYEASNDFTSASLLAKVESSHTPRGERSRSRLRNDGAEQ
ncbi:hypothetical protein FH972_021457 [Carpinus fangiana]|uniref:Phospholipid-transporting ATPase n=1 Tax=Carpinus fangiana TaxID=176857 RepID=A0A5N6KPQ7_9ROSI|nr:hypothetical protein FH972_021457 [Carpinus fangiana]